MQSLPMFSLVGQHEFAVVKVGLESLCRLCRDDYSLVLLHDGSLSAQQLEELQEAAPKGRVVHRSEMEDHMAPFLKNRPACAKYLHEHVLAWKLLPPPALAESTGGDLVIIDSDVLFFRPFTGLDRRAFSDEEYVFMYERRDSYSLDFRTRYVGADRIRLPEGANSGMVFSRAGVFDWDFMEWFLSRAAYRTYLGVLEQTAWAALGARSRCFSFDHAQVNIPNFGRDVSPELVAQHLVGHRKRLALSEAYGKLVNGVIGKTIENTARLRTRRQRMPGLFSSALLKGVRRMGRQSPVEGLKDPSTVMIEEVRQYWRRTISGGSEED